MSDIIPFDPTFVSQSVNFHGHNLLKQLVSENVAQIQNIKLQDIDYKVYQSRVAEIRNLGCGRVQEMIGFIASRSHYLLVTQPKMENLCLDDDDAEPSYKERYKYQLPLEYFMQVDKFLKAENFLKTVEEGDILYAEVFNYLEQYCALLKLLAFDMGKHRHFNPIKAVDIKVLMKQEDTMVPKTDEDKYGRWLIGTRLRVEVISVNYVGVTPCIMVGTKGVTLTSSKAKTKIHLGKVLLSDLPPVLSISADPSLKFLSQCLESMPSFKNPQSIKQLSQQMNIDLHKYSSLMTNLRMDYPESSKSSALRKSQMRKWAHKSVADGVMYFKKGQHEEAFQCLSKALQIDPDNVEAFVAKGALLANMGRYEKAIEDFKKSLELNPGHTNASKYMCETLVELGRQLEEKDKLKEAEKRYMECLDLNKEHKVAQEALNEVSKRTGNNYFYRRLYLQTIMKEEITKKEDMFLEDLLKMESELNKKRIKEEAQPIPEIIQNIEEQDPERKKSESPNVQPIPVLKEKPPITREVSLSPLSQKLAMQQNLWAPPPGLDTTMSFMQSENMVLTNPQPPVPDPALSIFSNPFPNWPMSTGPPSDTPLPVLDLTRPPPAVLAFNYDREDQSYKAKVEKFLKELEIRANEGKKSKSVDRSQSKKRNEHKRQKRRHSSSSSESSSSRSSMSSRSSSSYSSASSVERKPSKKSKKSKKKKRKKSKRSSKKSKAKKSIERDLPSAPEILIPDFKDLEEKLLAYYKKMETINTQEALACQLLTKSFSYSSELKGKTKRKSSSKTHSKSNAKKDQEPPKDFAVFPAAPVGMAALMQGTHPAFLEDSGDEVSSTPPKDAKMPSKKAAHITSKNKVTKEVKSKTKRASSSSSVTSSSFLSSSSSSKSYTRSRSRSASRGRKMGRRKYSRSRTRSRPRHKHRYSRSRSRRRHRHRDSRSSSRPRERHFVKKRSRSPPFGYYRNKPFFSISGRGRGGYQHRGPDVGYPSQPKPAPKPVPQPVPKLKDIKRPPEPLRSEQSKPPAPIKFELKKKEQCSGLDEAKRRIQQHLGTSFSQKLNEKNENQPCVTSEARFGKWVGDDGAKEDGENEKSSSKLGPEGSIPGPEGSLDQFEDFLKKAKEKNLEMLKQRNKTFLKPAVD